MRKLLLKKWIKQHAKVTTIIIIIQEETGWFIK